jgi:hypothetical protein
VHAPGDSGDRVGALRDLLNEWDFIGVADPVTNTDEYDCMLRPLLRKLAAGKDAQNIARWLRQEIEQHFGMSDENIADAELNTIAERISQWWLGAVSGPSTGH